MTRELKTEDFSTKVLENEVKPIVVKVWASWCHNCKTLAPIFQSSAEEHGVKVDFYGLKADDNIDLAKSLKIFGVPTVLFYRHGVLIAKKTGVVSQKSIAKTLQPLYEYSKEDAVSNAYKSLFKRIFSR